MDLNKLFLSQLRRMLHSIATFLLLHIKFIMFLASNQLRFIKKKFFFFYFQFHRHTGLFDSSDSSSDDDVSPPFRDYRNREGDRDRERPSRYRDRDRERDRDRDRDRFRERQTTAAVPRTIFHRFVFPFLGIS